MPFSELDKARRRPKIAIAILAVLLILGFWVTRGGLKGLRLVGAEINI
jgi:hypothetical protein